MHTSDDLAFRKSRHSASESACVEVADLPRGAAIRDSKRPEAGHLSFPADEWSAFVAAARSGEL